MDLSKITRATVSLITGYSLGCLRSVGFSAVPVPKDQLYLVMCPDRVEIPATQASSRQADLRAMGYMFAKGYHFHVLIYKRSARQIFAESHR